MRRFVDARAVLIATGVMFALAVASCLSACAQQGGAETPTPQATMMQSQAAPAGGTSTSPAKQVPGGNPEQGRQAIEKYGCGSCHTIPGVPGANGTVGPSLAGLAKLPSIVNTVPNTPDNLIKWIQNPQSVKPGTAMPNLSVTEPDARNIAAYLYTLQ